MDAVTKLLKKIQQIPAPAPKPEPVWKRLKAEHEARLYTEQFWERDKKRNREASFEKAKIKLEEYREEQRLEKERVAEFEAQRLKNLAKARRKLARLRAEGE